MKYNYIIDSHCHLDLIEEKDLDIGKIIENAKNNNVKLLQTICTKISEFYKLEKFINNYDFIYASLGIHPCNVDKERIYSADEIVKLCENNKIIGIGETGLDYFHDKSFIEKQKTSFLQHIKASQKNNLPVIIHSRDCDLDMAEILESEQKNKNFPALLHCFSSGKNLAKKALDLGIYISISGIVTFKNARDLQEIVKFIPLEYLLVETDSPYLSPEPYRGKINQPAYTKNTVKFISELKGMEEKEVISKTTENFHNLFTKAKSLN